MAHGDITHIDIPFDDEERAVSFYHDVFGWEIVEPPGFEGYPMWRSANGVSGGGFTSRTDGLMTPRSYIEVDSIDDTLAEIGANGGRTLLAKSSITPSSWWAVFEDSEGNQMGLFEGTTD